MKLFSTAVLVLGLTSINPAVAQAGAGDGVESRSATSASTSAAKSVTVTCPSGLKVVGASGSVSGDRTAVWRVRPSEDLTSVEVAAAEYSVGTAAPWTVTARANCAPGSYALVTKNGGKNAEADCPAGTKALGVGGEIVDLVNGVHLTTLAPQGGLTGAAVEASGPGGAWSVTAHAICGANSGLVLRTSSTVVLTPSGAKSVSCQAGEKVISAGGSVEGKAIIGDVLPFESSATLTGQAKDAQTQQIRWSIRPYAVCST